MNSTMLRGVKELQGGQTASWGFCLLGNQEIPTQHLQQKQYFFLKGCYTPYTDSLLARRTISSVQ